MSNMTYPVPDLVEGGEPGHLPRVKNVKIFKLFALVLEVGSR